MAKLVISDRILLDDDRVWKGGILIDERGLIERLLSESDVAIGLTGKTFDDRQVYDFSKYVIMAGLIDSHVHINEPGRSDWEGFETATKAAAAGGFTTICDMPLNSIPATTTVSHLQDKLNAAREQIYVDVCFWGGIIPDNVRELRHLAKRGVVGFKCFLCPSGVPEFPHVNEQQVDDALAEVQDLDVTIAFHAETCDEGCDKPADGDPNEYSTYLATRTPEMEINAIEMVARLALKYKKINVHIVHLSTADAIPIIRKYRQLGAINLTVETCHHYLGLNAEAVPRNRVEFKCCPPIRDKANQERLWQAVQNGDINLVVSDHSPSTPEMKLLVPGQPDFGNFMRSWGGISSLQFGLSLFWTNCQKYGLGMHDMVRLMSAEPARLCHIADQKGCIQTGYRADLCVWDPDAEFTVKPEIIQFRNRQTPYMGQVLKGVVHATIVGGQFAYERDAKEPLHRVGRMVTGGSAHDPDGKPVAHI